MSQDKIKMLLRDNPRGLTADELHEQLGLTNIYGQLGKLLRYGEITVNTEGKLNRYFIAESG